MRATSADEEFIRRHWAFAHRWAVYRLRTMGDKADPAAVVSDALLGVLRASKTWREDGGRTENAWVTYCIDHTITDGARQRYGDVRFHGRSTINRWVPWDDETGLRARDEYVVVTRQLDVQRAMRRLKPREVVAVRAYYWDELTLVEVGELLGIGESAASLMLRRAREKMRARLTA